MFHTYKSDMKKPVYIDILSDWGFKRIFGNEGSSEEFLMDFLNELFYDDSKLNSIVSVKFKNVEQTKKHKKGRGIRYDIICETSTGHRFIVEMQRRKHSNFPQRVTYYLCREIVEQGMKKNDDDGWFFDIIPVVGVFVTEFDLPGFEGRLKIQGRIADTETHKTLLDDIRCAFIQLKNFNKTPEKCKTGFDKWLYILKNMEQLKEVPFNDYKGGLFARVAELCRVSNLSKEEWDDYEAELKAERIRNAELKSSRDEGRDEGRAEEKFEIARNMKAKGLEISVISEITGLTLEEINKL